MAVRIETDPNVMMGKPVIAGTRITVELILEKLGAGETIEQIVDAHPRLTREAVLASLSFAARMLRAEAVGVTGVLMTHGDIPDRWTGVAVKPEMVG